MIKYIVKWFVFAITQDDRREYCSLLNNLSACFNSKFYHLQQSGHERMVMHVEQDWRI